MRAEPDRSYAPSCRAGSCIACLAAAAVFTGSNGVHAEPPTVNEQLARAIASENGEGVPKDQLVAAAIYCDAARSGSAEAAYRLGWMYANGRGVAHDDATASALFRMAAEKGHAYARNMLERMGDLHGMLPDCLVPPAPVLAEAPADEAADTLDIGPDPFADLPPWKRKIADLVDRMAPRYGIAPRLALAIIAVESNFDATAHSVKDARGLMQLIPETAARFNVRNVFDAQDNVRGGLTYLRWLLAYYRGQVKLAVAAYNAGERAVDRYGGVPPYPETREYVSRIVSLFRSDKHPYDPSIVEPSTITTRTLSGTH